MKHFDENSERQLNNDINEELEKLVVKPDNLIRVSKKIYDNIDKKSKMNNDKWLLIISNDTCFFIRLILCLIVIYSLIYDLFVN